VAQSVQLDISENNPITAQGIAHLTRRKKLQQLSICKTNLSAKDLLVLKGMNLRELRFSAAKMTERDLAKLSYALPFPMLTSHLTTRTRHRITARIAAF
jgi:hypothetical protein